MFINECRHIWFPLLADWFTILCWSLSSIATIIAKANVILASSVRGVCMSSPGNIYVDPFRITQSVVKSSQLQRKIDFLAARLVNRLCISLEGALVIAQLDCCCHCWGWLCTLPCRSVYFLVLCRVRQSYSGFIPSAMWCRRPWPWPFIVKLCARSIMLEI